VILQFKKEVYRVEDLNYLYSNMGKATVCKHVAVALFFVWINISKCKPLLCVCYNHQHFLFYCFVVEIQWATWCRFFQNITCFPSIELSQFGVPAHFKIIDQVAQIYEIALHVSGTTVDTVDLCLVEGNLSVKDIGAGEFLGMQRLFGQTMLWVPQNSYNMIHISFRCTSARCHVPCWLQQLGCEWNGKLQNWGRCSKVLSQLGFGNVLAQSSVLFLSYQKPNFKYQILCLQASSNLVEENIMYQHLKSICREKVRRIKFFWTNLGKYGQNIFCTPKTCQLLHQKHQRLFWRQWMYK